MEDDELLMERFHVDSINLCLLCGNTSVEAMHLMLAAEHVLCQSSLNSSLRRCSSTGFSSQPASWLPRSGSESVTAESKGTRASRAADLKAKRLLYVISWGQQSLRRAHQAVLLGNSAGRRLTQHKDWDESEAVNWKLHGSPAARYSTCQSTRCWQREAEFLYFAGLWWQNSPDCWCL